MLTLRRKPLAELDWQALDRLEDRTVAQTREWLAFLQQTQGAEPVVATLWRSGEHVGYFTGCLTRKLGVPILGSPFPGWTSPYMGFNLFEPIESRALVAELRRFAFRELGCAHLELMDRRWTPDDAERLAMPHRLLRTFEIDLTPSEDELFGRMDAACRRCVRKAEKEGVTIEVATDPDFASDYYAQLEDVFAKQGLRPTYRLDRVQALVTHLLPTGRLLLLRARDPNGRCIATGIFPAHNRIMHFWGGASWRAYQHLRPNETLQWAAMRYWKARGISRYDMGGGGDYKRKYGGEPIAVPWVRVSRFPLLPEARALAQSANQTIQRLAYTLKRGTASGREGGVGAPLRLQED